MGLAQALSVRECYFCKDAYLTYACLPHSQPGGHRELTRRPIELLQLSHLAPHKGGRPRDSQAPAWGRGFSSLWPGHLDCLKLC